MHRDGSLLAKAAAARCVTRLVDAVAAAGHAHLVLTGGGIGTAVLAQLAAAPARDAVDWRRVDFWWGDERFVPAGDPVLAMASTFATFGVAFVMRPVGAEGYAGLRRASSTRLCATTADQM